MRSGSNWAPLIAAIGASTIGIISVVTQHPLPVQQPTSLLGATVGGDLTTLQTQQTTGLLTLGVVGLAVFWLATRK